jgi:hypothetical protein
MLYWPARSGDRLKLHSLLFQGGVDDYGKLLEAAIKLPDPDNDQSPNDLQCN